MSPNMRLMRLCCEVREKKAMRLKFGVYRECQRYDIPVNHDIHMGGSQIDALLDFASFRRLRGVVPRCVLFIG